VSIVLGSATRADAEAIARLHRLALREGLPFLPVLHTLEEDVAFFRDRVLPMARVVVAEDEAERLVGFIAFRRGWVDHLYVHPDHQGRGIGRALMDRAQAAWPALDLWVFQRNLRARAFYTARGFRPVYETDGTGNEEQEPDLLMRWERRPG
jgi:putative acetyltransferase